MQREQQYLGMTMGLIGKYLPLEQWEIDHGWKESSLPQAHTGHTMYYREQYKRHARPNKSQTISILHAYAILFLWRVGPLIKYIFLVFVIRILAIFLILSR